MEAGNGSGGAAMINKKTSYSCDDFSCFALFPARVDESSNV